MTWISQGARAIVALWVGRSAGHGGGRGGGPRLRRPENSHVATEGKPWLGR